MKFYIRVTKNGITQGSAEFIITQLSFVKREEIVSKTLNVISLLKKEVIGKVLMKSKIQYTDTKGASFEDIPRSSSALPLENRSAQQNRGSMQTMNNGQFNSNKRTTLSTYISQFNSSNQTINFPSHTVSNKKNSTTGKSSTNFGSPNKRSSTDRKASMQKHAENVQLKEDLDTSRIETLFDDDKQPGIENVGAELTKFISDFKERYKGRFKEEENPEDRTEKGFQEIIERMFELQNIYLETFGKATSLNSILKSYLLTYSENYRMFNKKTNRLNELLETFTIKTKFSDHLNREDNKRLNDCFDIIRKEIKIYKNILKLKYDNELVEKYKQEMRSEKCKKYYFKNYR